ncbi:hypothetical protein F4678DRAFT_277780 [Xylaria arbuscula]|nr:hypothetical protein F4678DRAFT_277780 [Xylaria arbuscula]
MTSLFSEDFTICRPKEIRQDEGKPEQGSWRHKQTSTKAGRLIIDRWGMVRDGTAVLILGMYTLCTASVGPSIGYGSWVDANIAERRSKRGSLVGESLLNHLVVKVEFMHASQILPPPVNGAWDAIPYTLPPRPITTVHYLVLYSLSTRVYPTPGNRCGIELETE